jgi:predicted TIM-barrel fold metal-dependent hydrolase
MAGVFDADGHVVEPGLVFEELLEARFRSYAPQVVEYEDHFRYVCADRIGFRIFNRPDSVAAPGHTRDEGELVTARGADDPKGRIHDMDLDGLRIAALYPTYGLMIQGVTERAPALALCRAINDWLADYCSHDPSRLLGVGTLPLTHGDDALAEARRCVEDLGFKGVWRRPEAFEGAPPVHDEDFDPLWSYLEECGAPIAIHPGLNGVVPYGYFGERLGQDFAAMHAAHFPVEQMMNLTGLVAFGVLERHPKLRVALLESGAGWALSYLHRLDEHHESYELPAKLSLRPSEYFRRQCFVSVEEPEPALDLMLERYPESVVFASDYPHGDCTFPGATDALRACRELSEEKRDAVFWSNPCRLYGIDVEAPR